MTDSPWPNFSYSELACKCGRCGVESGKKINPYLMYKVQLLRDKCGPLAISSAYRCAEHPNEASKTTPGTHHQGVAVDIRCSGEQAWKILSEAMQLGCFTGIGVKQKGSHGTRFIHLDIASTSNRPWVWSY